MKKPKRPRDPNQLAKSIVDLATSEVDGVPGEIVVSTLNIHAVELGRLGGLVGGKARARKLSKANRVKIARAGAKARWNKANRKRKNEE